MDDQPLPLEGGAQGSAAAHTRFVRRSLGIVTLGWVFGSVWMNSTGGAPLTLFAKGLGATPFQFGLLSALPFIASLVSMPASLLIERTGRRKSIFLHGLYTQRLMWFVIALAPVLMVTWHGPAAAPRAMGMVLMLMFLMHAAGAFGGPAWVSWMADVVPERLRGKYFSRRRQCGIMSAIPAALLVGWVLDRGASSGSAGSSTAALWVCAGVFTVAAVFGFVDIHVFQYLPETPKPPHKGLELLTALEEPLKNKRFLSFAGFVATLTFAVSFMGQFVTLYLIEKVHVGNTGTQLMLLVAPMLAQLVVLPVWGKACDRMGKKPVLVVAALGLVPVGMGWCLVTESHPWLGYVVSAAGTALWTGVEIANFNLVLEMSSAHDGGKGGGSSYVAVNSVIVNIAGCLGGFAAGFISQGLAGWSWQPPVARMKAFTFYDVLFALSGLLRLAAVVIFLPFVHEPAARGSTEALRFMCANIYNNLHHALLQPIRCVAVRHHRREQEVPEEPEKPVYLRAAA